MKPNIKKMFEELNQEHFGGAIPSIPVVWNARMTTTAGVCRFKRYGRVESVPVKIDLSEKLFRNLNFDLAKVERTLVHEMVHAYLLHKYNEKGHTARFQRMMTNITGEYKNHRCHNYDTTGLKRKQEKKVQGKCLSCGFTYELARMPKHASYSTYTHKGCGGKMTFSKKDPENKVNIF